MKKIWTLFFCTFTAALHTGCGETCTTEAPPAMVVELKADGATAEQLCNAQVIASDAEGYVSYAQGWANQDSEGQPVCTFSLAHERPGTYDVQVRVQDFEPVTLEDIQVSADQCHVQTRRLSVALTGATNNCHDGYEWVEDACKTPNGCTFPLLERENIPGVQGAEITYDCVDRCESMGNYFFEMPEAPGRCAALALP